jgi:N-acetyl-anhydromuramyl-L-alanine amidase AmpD
MASPRKTTARDPSLSLRLWSAFTIDLGGKRSGPRWNVKPVKENVVRGAVGAILNETIASRRPSDANGQTTIDIGNLTGTHILRLTPAAQQRSSIAAGVALNVTNGADRAYRVVDITLQIDHGKLKAATINPPQLNVAVISFSDHSLDIDWKADWVRATRADARPAGSAVSAIVLHRTEASTIGSSLDQFISGAENSHYVVDVDGHVVKMINDAGRGAHAGTGAQWRGASPLNNFAVGIESVNDGGAFPSAQMQAVVRLVRDLSNLFPIRKEDVVGHCEVKPLKPDRFRTNDRITCPGPDFEWKLLEDIDLAVRPTPRVRPPLAILPVVPVYDAFFAALPGGSLVRQNSDRGALYGIGNRKIPQAQGIVATLKSHLQTIGYEAPESPTDYDQQTLRIVERFQARYFSGSRAPSGTPVRPTLGEADQLTINAILGVLRERGLA